MRNVKKYIFVALLVSLGARLYVSFFIPGFIITFTAIILGIALYFNDDIHPIILSFIVAVMSPSMRFVFESLSNSGSTDLLSQIYPDVFFYLTYGLVFYVISKLMKQQLLSKFYVVLFFSDFISNLVELLVRTRFFDIEWPMIQGILLVAIGRTALTMLTIYVMVRYTSLLMRKEHEKRYQYLMMLSSRFKSEIYFLHKNMNQIERLVSMSHNIKNMTAEDEALRTLTLDLSKGVHEIKKDYLRAIQGLEEIYDSGMDLNELSLRDLFKIIEQNSKDYLRNREGQIDFQFKCKTNIMVKQHFYLMSILRNLINNAIEACDYKGKISVYAQEVNDTIEIYVRDDGTGIKSDDKAYIFNTGYSTKFNKETGDIYRGIGLTLVKEMTENIFKGQLSYETEVGQGTSFIVTLNKTVVTEGV